MYSMATAGSAIDDAEKRAEDYINTLATEESQLWHRMMLAAALREVQRYAHPDQLAHVVAEPWRARRWVHIPTAVEVREGKEVLPVRALAAEADRLGIALRS